MKIKSIFLAASVAAVFASCGQVSDMTQISGTVVPEGISEVNIVIEDVIDTLVPVTDGRFAVSVPTDITTIGVVMVANIATNFIPDGTPLEVVLDEESTVKSKYPRISINERMNLYNADESKFLDEFQSFQQTVFADTLLTDEQKRAKFEEFYSEFEGRYYAHHEKACVENSDNFISVLALNALNGQDNDKILELIDAMDPAIQENKYVASIKDGIEASLATAEGKMFTDFTVNSVVGHTRSIPPQPVYSEVKLSDYVGKGKYILLDFWSPWCGPCRREMPNIKAVYDKYKGDKFDVVSIAVWEREPVEVTIETAEKLNMTWKQINNAGTEPAALYGVQAIPHLILFGPDGTILKRGFHGAEIEEIVSSYLQ